MKLKLLKPIDFRTDKFKAGDVVEIPEGLSQKLILDGIALKASALDLVIVEDEIVEAPEIKAPTARKKKGKK